jgi:hypothetical protein
MAKGPQYRDAADAFNLMRVMAWFVPACFTMLGFLWYFMLDKGWIPTALFVVLIVPIFPEHRRGDCVHRAMVTAV